MEKLKTAKGHEFDSDYVVISPASGQAYIRIKGASLATVASVFGDKSETAVIKYGSRILTRYTRLVAIVPEVDAVKVILGKE